MGRHGEWRGPGRPLLWGQPPHGGWRPAGPPPLHGAPLPYHAPAQHLPPLDVPHGAVPPGYGLPLVQVAPPYYEDRGGYGGVPSQGPFPGAFPPPQYQPTYPDYYQQQHTQPLPEESPPPLPTSRPPSQQEEGELARPVAAMGAALEMVQQAAEEQAWKKQCEEEAKLRKAPEEVVVALLQEQAGEQAGEGMPPPFHPSGAAVAEPKSENAAVTAAAAGGGADDEAQRPGSGGGSQLKQQQTAPRITKPLGIKANRSLAGNIQIRPRSTTSSRGRKGSFQDTEVAAEMEKAAQDFGRGGKKEAEVPQAVPQPEAAAKEQQQPQLQQDGNQVAAGSGAAAASGLPAQPPWLPAAGQEQPSQACTTQAPPATALAQELQLGAAAAGRNAVGGAVQSIAAVQGGAVASAAAPQAHAVAVTTALATVAAVPMPLSGAPAASPGHPPGFLFPAAPLNSAVAAAQQAAEALARKSCRQLQLQVQVREQAAQAEAEAAQARHARQLAEAEAAAKSALAAADKKQPTSKEKEIHQRRRRRSRSRSTNSSRSEGEVSSRSRSSSYYSRSSSYSSYSSRSRSRSGDRRRECDRQRRSHSRSRERWDGRRYNTGQRDNRRDDQRYGRPMWPGERYSRPERRRPDLRPKQRWDGRWDERFGRPGDGGRRGRDWDARDSRPPAAVATRERDARGGRWDEQDVQERARDTWRGSPVHTRRSGSPDRRRRTGAAANGQPGPTRRRRSRSGSLERQAQPAAKRQHRGSVGPVSPPAPELLMAGWDNYPKQGQPMKPEPQNSPDISDKLRQLAALHRVDWDAADAQQLYTLHEGMMAHAAAPEPPEFFAWQCEQLDALARQLLLPAPPLRDATELPFTGEDWCRQVPEAELIAENSIQAPHRMPLEQLAAGAGLAAEPAGRAAAAGEVKEEVPEQGAPERQQEAAAVEAKAEMEAQAEGEGKKAPAAAPETAVGDPRRQPAAAAEYGAAAAWHQSGELPLPDFALPVTVPAESGLSWSQDPRSEGQQQEATSSAVAACGGEERAPGDGDELYAPAAPRHDDAFHRSMGGPLSLGGRHASGSSTERPAEIEEGYWSAMLPGPRGITFTSPRQLDVLQEQVRQGQLEPGWPIYRESDRLHCYLTDNPPLLADLAWPNPKPSRTPDRFVLAFAQLPPAQQPAAAAVGDGAASVAAKGGVEPKEEGEKEPGAGPEQQPENMEVGASAEQQQPQQLSEQEQLAAEEAALRALQQRAATAGVGMSTQRALDALLSQPAQLVGGTKAAAKTAADTAVGLEDWLRRSSQPGSAAAQAGQQLVEQRRMLRSARQPLQRLHGPPPPANVGAAVRQLLLQQRSADLVLKKVLAEVAHKLAEERARQQEEWQELQRRTGGVPERRRETHSR